MSTVSSKNPEVKIMPSLPKGKSLVAVRALERLLTSVNPLVLPDIDFVNPKMFFFGIRIWSLGCFIVS